MHAAGSLLHHLPALPAPTLLFTSNLGPEAPCLELATNAMQSGSQVLQLFRTQHPFPLQALSLNSRSVAKSHSFVSRHENLLMRSLQKASQIDYLNFRFKDHLLLKDHYHRKILDQVPAGSLFDSSSSSSSCFTFT